MPVEKQTATNAASSALTSIARAPFICDVSSVAHSPDIVTYSSASFNAASTVRSDLKAPRLQPTDWRHARSATRRRPCEGC